MMESPSFIGGRLDTRFLERTTIMETERLRPSTA